MADIVRPAKSQPQRPPSEFSGYKHKYIYGGFIFNNKKVSETTLMSDRKGMVTNFVC